MSGGFLTVADPTPWVAMSLVARCVGIDRDWMGQWFKTSVIRRRPVGAGDVRLISQTMGM